MSGESVVGSSCSRCSSAAPSPPSCCSFGSTDLSSSSSCLSTTAAPGAAATTISSSAAAATAAEERFRLNRGLAEMLKGGVIMDVMTAEQARIAESAGACAVMALEKIPADIRLHGGVARMSAVEVIEEVINAVSIPVMAKVRIGHFVEAQILQQLQVDYIDESEVLSVADEHHHIYKKQFNAPFVCGARNLGEALRRIAEGASMIRTKGEAGTGNIVEAVRHIRSINGDIARLKGLRDDELPQFAREIRAPLSLVETTKRLGRLPVVNFAAGGIATPADAALCMQLGVDGVFVGSGIFKSSMPGLRAAAIVKATTHFSDGGMLVAVSRGIGEPMVGVGALRDLPEKWARREGGEEDGDKK